MCIAGGLPAHPGPPDFEDLFLATGVAAHGMEPASDVLCPFTEPSRGGGMAAATAPRGARPKGRTGRAWSGWDDATRPRALGRAVRVDRVRQDRSERDRKGAGQVGQYTGKLPASTSQRLS